MAMNWEWKEMSSLHGGKFDYVFDFVQFFVFK